MASEEQHWLSRRDERQLVSVNIDLLAGSTFVAADGGLINNVSRVTIPTGDVYALRAYAELPDASAASRFDRETHLLATLARHVPVPRPVLADASCGRLEQPFVLYPWIEGITLNECRRAHGSAILEPIAGELGRTLATIAASHVRLGDRERFGRLAVADEMSRTNRLLESSLARERLGGDTADALRRFVERHAAVLVGHDSHASLVHGDFGGRNIIVRADDTGAWMIAGILDWESATTGSPLWDVGSLFRYARRYSVEFRADFARGYTSGGGWLPDGWWLQSRVLDITRVVATLNEERDLGSVFDECRQIVGDLLEPPEVHTE